MAGDKQKQVTEILKQLTIGKSYSEILADVGKKWQMAQRTFDRRWKEAKEQHTKNQDAARMAMADKALQADVRAVESGVIGRERRLQILSEIAQATGTGEGANKRDRMTAIDMLTRMGEGYSPVKKDFQIDSNRDFEIIIE